MMMMMMIIYDEQVEDGEQAVSEVAAEVSVEMEKPDEEELHTVEEPETDHPTDDVKDDREIALEPSAEVVAAETEEAAESGVHSETSEHPADEKPGSDVSDAGLEEERTQKETGDTDVVATEDAEEADVSVIHCFINITKCK